MCMFMWSASQDTVHCYLCEKDVDSSAKHCRYCDKCVRGFDHHWYAYPHLTHSSCMYVQITVCVM